MSYQDLLTQRAELDRKIKAARAQELADVIGRIRKDVQAYELSPHDIFGRATQGATKGSKVDPKYRDPATGKEWTGRGKAPIWIAGKDREQFLIAQPTA